jgi:Flp pilus assembly protein TadD
LLLGDSYRHAGRCDDAIPEYRKVVSMRPLEKKANLNLVVCLIRQQQLDEAERVMADLDAADPTSLDAIMTLGVLAALRQDPDKARVYFQTAVDRHPKLEDARRMLAFVSGILPENEHRQLCEELQTFAPAFNVSVCMDWRRRTKT